MEIQPAESVSLHAPFLLTTQLIQLLPSALYAALTALSALTRLPSA